MLRVVLVALLIVIGGRSAAAQYQAGDKVVVVVDAQLQSGREYIEPVWPGLTLTVRDVNGEWIYLSNGKGGWLESKNVIPLDRRAIDRLTRMIQAKPNDAQLYSGRAWVWEELGELDIAIGDFNEAIRLNPSATRYNNRGRVWHAKQQYDRAIADYDEAIRLDPKDAAAYNNRGITWGDKQEYDRAIADFDEAIRLDPKDAMACSNRGFARIIKQEYGRAIEDLNEALRLDPKHVLAYSNRGVARWLSRVDAPGAIADFRRMSELLGNASDGCYSVIYAVAAARIYGEPGEAERLLAEADGKYTADWPAPALDFFRGKITEKELLAQATDDAKQAQAHCYSGLAHLIADRRTEARREFQRTAEYERSVLDEIVIAVAELKRLDATHANK